MINESLLFRDLGINDWLTVQVSMIVFGIFPDRISNSRSQKGKNEIESSVG